MKISTLLYFFLFFSQPILAQSIDFEKLKINGQNIWSSKSSILEKFGKPKSIINPDYECGFLSSSEQMKEFESLVYSNFIFTGNADDKFILDKFELDDRNYTVIYCGIVLDQEFTIEKLEEIFGQFHDPYPNEQTNFITIPNQDKFKEDGFMFEFNNGKLVSINYWSPC